MPNIMSDAFIGMMIQRLADGSTGLSGLPNNSPKASCKHALGSSISPYNIEASTQRPIESSRCNALTGNDASDCMFPFRFRCAEPFDLP
jgi:hypothetical protein